MDKKKYAFGLILVTWLGILGMIMLRYGLVLLLGDELVVPTQGFDPRDTFRGEYVRLGYQFSEWQVNDYTGFFKAQRVYVVPILSGNHMMGIHTVTPKRPNDGMYVTARIASIHDQGPDAYSYIIERDNSGTIRRDLYDINIYDKRYSNIYTYMTGDKVSLRICDWGSGPFIDAFDRTPTYDTVVSPQCRLVRARVVGRSRTPIRITLTYSPDRYFVQAGSGIVREEQLRNGNMNAVWRVWRGHVVLDRLEMRK